LTVVVGPGVGAIVVVFGEGAGASVVVVVVVFGEGAGASVVVVLGLNVVVVVVAVVLQN